MVPRTFGISAGEYTFKNEISTEQKNKCFWKINIVMIFRVWVWSGVSLYVSEEVKKCEDDTNPPGQKFTNQSWLYFEYTLSNLNYQRRVSS